MRGDECTVETTNEHVAAVLQFTGLSIPNPEDGIVPEPSSERNPTWHTWHERMCCGAVFGAIRCCHKVNSYRTGERSEPHQI